MENNTFLFIRFIKSLFLEIELNYYFKVFIVFSGYMNTYRYVRTFSVTSICISYHLNDPTKEMIKETFLHYASNLQIKIRFYYLDGS